MSQKTGSFKCDPIMRPILDAHCEIERLCSNVNVNVTMNVHVHHKNQYEIGTMTIAVFIIKNLYEKLHFQNLNNDFCLDLNHEQRYAINL